ncbi:MAG: P-loop containing nucleoside triphosphate hydrolase protein [Monoraphidium minutum]|nr:MAG: P-loop containing nucleoside triphosphate hydrolase protein [Monoraphidium minutum]
MAGEALRAAAGDAAAGGEGGPLQEQQGAFTYAQIAANLERLDGNQLQTALSTAIAAEDYVLAAAIRDRLAAVAAADGSGRSKLLDWEALGVLDWVADRAARLGLRFPTEVQRRSTPVILSGSDAVVQSETGSGKTAAFLVPALSRLSYPPDLYLEDMMGPQLLVLVPTFELGTQVALLLYKMFGGNISSQRPGDPANMFTFFGPRSLKVRGLLTDQDVNAAMMEPKWLASAHVIVGTPPEVLHASTCENPYLDLTDLRVLVADEVDELMHAYPSSFRAILDLVVGNGLEGDDLKPGQAVQVVLVGATVTGSEVEEAVARHWVSDPVVVRVGSPGSVPSGLRHRALVVADAGRRLAALVSMLRRDLVQAGLDEEPARVIVFAASDEAARTAADPLRTALWTEHQLSVLLPSGAEPVKALHAFRDRAASLLLATPSASRGLDLPAVSHVYNLGPPAGAKDYLHRAGRAGRIGSTTGGLVTTIVAPNELAALTEIAEELGLALAVEGEDEQGLGLLPPQQQQLEEQQGGAGGGVGGGEGQQPGDLDALKRGLEDIFKLL